MKKKKKTTYTPARAKAIQKYQEKIDRIYITAPAGTKDILKEHAKTQEESLNAFVYRSCIEQIKRDNDTTC